MLNKMIYKCLILSCFCLFACEGKQSAQTNQTIVQLIPPAPPTDTLIGTDPYFVGSQEVVSTFGPNSITRSMTQDARGHYWFASWQGIIQFDGKEFTNMTLLNSLHRFHVFNSFTTRNGEIWFGTIRGGVYRFDGQSFKHYTTRDGLSDNWVEWIFEDNSGKIWLGGNEGLNVFDGHSFTIKTGPPQRSPYEVHSITQDKDGQIWIGAGDGVWVFDQQRFREFKKPDGSSLSNTRSVIKDKADHLWMAGATGLYRWDGKKLESFFDGFAGYVYTDRQGTIWFAGSEKGSHNMHVYRIINENVELFQPVEMANPGMVFFIFEDQKGDMWFGIDNKGVFRYDGNILHPLSK